MSERKATAKNLTLDGFKKLLLFFFTILTLVFSYYVLVISSVNAQFPPPYVPCGSRSPEFHSLRPYQASPCDQGVSEVALFCGNSLILSDRVSRTQTIAPNVASNCKPLGNSKYRCSFTFNKITNIAIDLSEAELPILGNTQNVINSRSQEEGLTDADKVNEYISWYLNGTIYRAEYPYPSLEDQEDINKIISYSGPLNKLLPLEIQKKARIATIEKAVESDDRHDQIAACTYGIPVKILGLIKIFEIGGIPGPCYSKGLASLLPRESHRISEWKNKLPPLEEEIGTKYDDFIDYWITYQRWRGKSCAVMEIPETVPLIGTKIPIIGGKKFFFCGENVFKPNYYATLFPYIPYSSTEDRKGLVSLSSSNVTAASPNVKLTNVSLNVEPAELFFSHTEESVELASLLQKTFVPKEGVDETGPVNNVSPGEFCDLLNVRSNSGDDLFAGEIAGVLSYTADFSCEMDAGDAGKICDKDVSISLNVQTETPQADELWSRLVAGPAAVFKRIFPKIGVGSAIEGLLDMPAVTNVNYSADNLVSIGNPSAQRTGAELYFPHLGGIHEYFLKGIQTILRPKGFGESILSGSPDTITSSGDIDCNQSAPEVSLKGVKNKEEFFQLALDWVSGQLGNHALECYNDTVAKSRAAGVNPALALWIWVHESDASNYNLSLEDFGVHFGAPSGFNAQISGFLSRTKIYNTGHPTCQGTGVSNDLEAFAYIYRSGECSSSGEGAAAFYNDLVTTWNWVAPGCPLPKSATDNSCP